MISQKFSKKERLKSRKKIQRLFEYGKPFKHYPFRIIWQVEEQYNPSNLARIAISVSKRNIKKAKDRNYIKRKIREAYRKNKYLLYNDLQERKQSICFMVIFSTSDDLSHISVEDELVKAIQKIKKEMIKYN
ncbi:MAG: ribonuclease P protein component [Bacteroidales bacterium]